MAEDYTISVPKVKFEYDGLKSAVYSITGTVPAKEGTIISLADGVGAIGVTADAEALGILAEDLTVAGKARVIIAGNVYASYVISTLGELEIQTLFAGKSNINILDEKEMN